MRRNRGGRGAVGFVPSGYNSPVAEEDLIPPLHLGLSQSHSPGNIERRGTLNWRADRPPSHGRTGKDVEEGGGVCVGQLIAGILKRQNE